MTKEQKIEKVKDLLNQVVVICGKSKDDFLSEVSTTVENLLLPEVDNDYYNSDEYYDSSCSWYPSEDSDED